MKKNMGNIDRVIRVLIAITAVILFATGVVEGALGIVLIAVAAIFTLTSFVSFCPIYAALGLRSKRAADNKS